MSLQVEIEKLCQQGKEYLDAERFDEANDAFGQALDLDARHPKALLGRSVSLRKLAEFQAAQHVLNRALYLFPSNAGMLKESGLLRFDQAQYGEASEYFERAIAVSPNDPGILELKLISLRLKGPPFDDAEKATAGALAQFPGEAGLLNERARLYYDQGRYDEAVEASLEANNRDLISEVIGSLTQSWRYAEAEQLIESALSRFPEDVEILNSAGVMYFDQGDYEQAVVNFERVLAVDQQNEDALVGRIRSLCGLGPPFERAHEAMAEALASLPGNNKLLRICAWLYIEQKLYDQAVEAFVQANSEDLLDERIGWFRTGGQFAECERLIEAALSRLPKRVTILNELGRLHFYREDYAKAAESFERALNVDSQNEDALEWKIKSLRRQGPPFDRTQKAIAEALAKLPQNRALLTERAWLHYDQKQYDLAVESFVQAKGEDALIGEISSLRDQRHFAECGQLIDAALSRLPKNVAFLKQRGWLRVDQRDYKKATTAFEQVLAVEPGDETALRWRSVSLRLQRLFAEAEAAIKEGIGRHPKSAALLNERGWVYFDQAQYEKAIEAFNQTLNSEPKNEDALQWKIRSLRAKNDFAATEKAIEEALVLAPASAEILFERGRLHYDRDEFEKADEYYCKAISAKPDYLEPHFARVAALNRLNRGEHALDVLEGLRLERPDDLNVRNQLGWFYIGRNDLANARKEFEAILKADPTSTVGLNSMGVVYFNQGQYERAEVEFRRALEAEPNNFAPHNNLAWALVRQVTEASTYAGGTRQLTWLERAKHVVTNPAPATDAHPATDYLGEAEKHCRAALEIEPNIADTYGCLGVIAFKRGRLIDSEDFFQMSVRLDSKEGSYVDLGALYLQMGRFEEAGKVLEKAREVNRVDARARVELGNLYLQTDRLKDATRMFREAMALEPHGEGPPRALAIALTRAGDYTEAARVVRRAIREIDESKRWRLHLTLCQLLCELGDKNVDLDLYDEALKEVLIATALKPAHPAPYFSAGIVHYKLEEYQRARRSFTKCLEKDPNHFEAELNLRRVNALLRREFVRNRVVQVAGGALAIICFALLFVLWFLYFKTQRVTQTMVNTLSPILLGLVFVALLLPWLTRLKLPGVEADLSQPKEKVSAGPTGAVVFGTSSLSSGPQ